MSEALTALSEDEQLFRDSCRSFAQGRIWPLVRKMDEEAKLEPTVIPELFDLGLMGIHIPAEFGGGAGSFFMSVLAVEEISRVDASFGVFIDVQNTLVNNAIMRWANDGQKRKYLQRPGYHDDEGARRDPQRSKWFQNALSAAAGITASQHADLDCAKWGVFLLFYIGQAH